MSLLADLHGPHQEAQKSNSTTLPFKEDNFNVSPFNEGNAISNASLPCFG